MFKIYCIVHSNKSEHIVTNTWKKLLKTMTLSKQKQYTLKIFNYRTLKSLESIPGDADIYIARGQVCEYFRNKNSDYVVLSVPFTLLNIIEILKDFNSMPRESIKAALICSTPLENIENAVKDALNINLTKYTIPLVPDCPQKELLIRKLIIRFSKQGYNMFLGGYDVEEIANEMGFSGVYVDYSKEGIENILQQAINTSPHRRADRESIVRFQSLLNIKDEGIVIADSDDNIIYINDCASSYFNIESRSWIGVPIEKLNDKSILVSVLTQSQNNVKSIININNTSYIYTKIHSYLNNEKIGKIFTFKKINYQHNKENSQFYTKELYLKYSFENIKGNSPCLLSTIKRAKIYASVDSNVIIIGQSGTGKELFAQSIHSISDRKNNPFIAVNCAAIPSNLMESEFFGYAPGAFTGASQQGKKGYFEIANHGTLFLDEVSELNFNMQARLLRVIAEKQIMRIGDNKVIPINVRIISATNKDLKKMVKKGTFREDLYYRLKVLTLCIPSLKERNTDILLLTEYYLNYFSKKLNRSAPNLSDETKEKFLLYHWPGNIRELRNLCEEFVVLGDESIFESEISSNDTSVISTPFLAYRGKTPETEKEKIYNALQTCKFNKTKTAQLLQINRTTLWKKIKKYGLDKD